MLRVRRRSGQGSITSASGPKKCRPHIVLCLSSAKVHRSTGEDARTIFVMDGDEEILDPAMSGSNRAPAPLPEDALDALVIVLDEIRLGRSRSRSELVQRTRSRPGRSSPSASAS